jgi:hypothetical protein
MVYRMGTKPINIGTQVDDGMLFLTDECVGS